MIHIHLWIPVIPVLFHPHMCKSFYSTASLHCIQDIWKVTVEELCVCLRINPIFYTLVLDQNLGQFNSTPGAQPTNICILQSSILHTENFFFGGGLGYLLCKHNGRISRIACFKPQVGIKSIIFNRREVVKGAGANDILWLIIPMWPVVEGAPQQVFAWDPKNLTLPWVTKEHVCIHTALTMCSYWPLGRNGSPESPEILSEVIKSPIFHLPAFLKWHKVDLNIHFKRHCLFWLHTLTGEQRHK